MFAADEAEARGDADGALAIMEAFAVGPDGRHFWRPWRIERLQQVSRLGADLPGWAVSRWIVEQALSFMHEDRRGLLIEAEARARQLRGTEALDESDEHDARARTVDRDWVYRQQFLYELGALDHFLRDQAGPELVAAADGIHEWSATPMGGFELVASTPSITTWRDLGDGASHSGPNIGSAAFMNDGEHVIGRLVPVGEGRIFETRPVEVPGQVAADVAARPDEWPAAVAAGMEEWGLDAFPTDGVHHRCFLSDVPPSVWGLVVDDLSFGMVTDPGDLGPELALPRAVLVGGRLALNSLRGRRPKTPSTSGRASMPPFSARCCSTTSRSWPGRGMRGPCSSWRAYFLSRPLPRAASWPTSR